MYVTGDTRPVIVRYLRRDGAAITNLDSASSISWKAYSPSGAKTLTKACTVTDAATGKVTAADLVAADLDETGWWLEEVLITWSAGNVEHPEKAGRFYVRAEFGEGQG